MCDKGNGTGFCSVNCMASQIGDKKCDEVCFNAACRWDGDDCDSITCDDNHRNNSIYEPECLNAACRYDAPDCQHLMGCAPLLGALSKDSYYVMCGGSLISPTWVLTAGHCVEDGRTALTQGFRPGNTTSTVASVYAHPDFDLDLLNNDLALLKLAAPITGVQTVDVASSDYPDPAVGTKMWALGWGTLYSGGGSPLVLREVKLPIIDRERCRHLYNSSVILDSAICTMYREGGRDGCQGDSGGPLVHVGKDGRMTQVGLTSWGFGCADIELPGVWTRLSSFRSWIDATMAAVDAGTKVCSCPSKHIGNGYCNIFCYTEECKWDGGDCNNTAQCAPGCTPAMLANSVCDPQCATPGCSDDNGVCNYWDKCSDQCLNSMIDNGHCDTACLTSRCMFDGDDCRTQFCNRDCPTPLINNTHCNPACNTANCSFDGGDCRVDSSHCAPECLKTDVGNGWCTIACNVSACSFDGGDCANLSQCHEPKSYMGDAYCDSDYNTAACNYDRGMCDKVNGTGFCSVNCRASQIGDKKCDEACFNAACRWDGYDCDSNTCDNNYECLNDWTGDGFCDLVCLNRGCGYDGGDCFDLQKESCAPGCFPIIHRNNSVCEPECLNVACGYDAPDCQHYIGCAPFCLSTWIHDGECDQAVQRCWRGMDACLQTCWLLRNHVAPALRHDSRGLVSLWLAAPQLLRPALALCRQPALRVVLLGPVDSGNGEAFTASSAELAACTASGRALVLVDAPGRRDFVASTFRSLARCGCAVLVVSAAAGEFEDGLGASGSVRVQAWAARFAGVARAVVAVNKMDDPSVAEQQHEGGGSPLAACFVPVSAWAGDNVASRSERMRWYAGPTLLEAIERAEEPPLLADQPLRVFLEYTSAVDGGPADGRHRSEACGAVLAGVLVRGDRVVCVAQGEQAASVDRIEVSGELRLFALPGERVSLRLRSGVPLPPSVEGLVVGPAEGSGRTRACASFAASVALLEQPCSVQLAVGSLVVVSFVHAGRAECTVAERSEEASQLSRRAAIRSLSVRLCPSVPLCVDAGGVGSSLGLFLVFDDATVVAVGRVREAFH
eukprot:m51a1_g5256 putative peptidase c14 (1066) ;mRNA; f:78358-85182